VRDAQNGFMVASIRFALIAEKQTMSTLPQPSVSKMAMSHNITSIENEPTIVFINEEDLPEVADWKIGKKYTVELSLRMLGAHIQQFGARKGRIQAEFSLMKAKNPHKEKLPNRY